jgi:hypothetical protein
LKRGLKGNPKVQKDQKEEHLKKMLSPSRNCSLKNETELNAREFRGALIKEGNIMR